MMGTQFVWVGREKCYTFCSMKRLLGRCICHISGSLVCFVGYELDTDSVSTVDQRREPEDSKTLGAKLPQRRNG